MADDEETSIDKFLNMDGVKDPQELLFELKVNGVNVSPKILFEVYDLTIQDHIKKCVNDEIAAKCEMSDTLNGLYKLKDQFDNALSDLRHDLADKVSKEIGVNIEFDDEDWS